MKRPFVALLLLVSVAALAPLLATSLPWLARTDSGEWGMPAFAALTRFDLIGLAVATLAWAVSARRGTRWRCGLVGALLMGAAFLHQPVTHSTAWNAVISAPCRHDPSTRDFLATRVSSWSRMDHPLGTDSSGRDLFARTLHGLRTSLAVALLATVLATAIGIVLGLIAALGHRAFGRVLGLMTDATLAFPAIFAVLVARTFLPPSIESFVLIVGVFRIPLLAQVTLVAAESLRNSEFVRAEEGLGQSRVRIALKTLLPHASGPALALAGFGISGAILAEAGLGFLGLGIPAEYPSLGNLLEEVRDLAWADPFVMVVPGLVLLSVAFASHASSETVRRYVQAEMEPSS